MRGRTLARLVLALCVAGAAASIPLIASADHSHVVDANDTKGPFDVRRVIVRGTRTPRYDVVTFTRWSVAQVWDRSYGFVYFDTFGDEDPDYYVLVRSDGYRMRALLYRDRTRKNDRIIGKVKAWRPGKRSFAVKVPLRKMTFPQQRLVYFWWVQTLHTGTSCKRVCFDRAPNRERVAEPVPGAGQSPAPSPSVTVVPSLSPSPTATST
ncbi:MAG TPA: hypothetical protein VG318_09745 [Actinomycetota bacterium]|nr:hypothetical protein [Actinomycetota bacterium]